MIKKLQQLNRKNRNNKFLIVICKKKKNKRETGNYYFYIVFFEFIRQIFNDKEYISQKRFSTSKVIRSFHFGYKDVEL